MIVLIPEGQSPYFLHTGNISVLNGTTSEGSYLGSVQLTTNGVSYVLCADSQWDTKDAQIVCKQLGYLRAVNASSTTVQFHEYAMSNLRCRGNESALLDCPYDLHHHYSCAAGNVTCVKGQDKFLLLVKCLASYFSKSVQCKIYHLIANCQ